MAARVLFKDEDGATDIEYGLNEYGPNASLTAVAIIYCRDKRWDTVERGVYRSGKLAELTVMRRFEINDKSLV